LQSYHHQSLLTWIHAWNNNVSCWSRINGTCRRPAAKKSRHPQGTKVSSLVMTMSQAPYPYLGNLERFVVLEKPALGLAWPSLSRVPGWDCRYPASRFRFILVHGLKPTSWKVKQGAKRRGKYFEEQTSHIGMLASAIRNSYLSYNKTSYQWTRSNQK